MKILKAMKPDMAKKFSTFYISLNLPIPIDKFIAYPLELTIGVYIKFFDLTYGLGIVYDRNSYCIYSSDKKLTNWQDRTKPLASEYFKKSEDTLVNAEKAIIRIIDLTSVPF